MTYSKPNLAKLLLAGILASLFCCGTAQAWWNADWTIRKKIVIDTTATGVPINDTIGSVPVLLRLHDGNFQFQAAKDDGSDIRFVAADDQTLLTYHIEKYDSLLSEAYVWVKVPDLKPGTQTTIWLYYGNSGNPGASVNDPKGTYDADTVLVYHFGEHGAPAADSSGHNNNSKNAGASTDAFIGSGLRFIGHLPVTIPNSPTLAMPAGGALALSMWVKPAVLQPDAVVFSRHDGSSGFVIGLDKGAPFVEVSGPNGTQRTPAVNALAANSWHHLAVVAAASKLTLFVDGEPSASISAALPALASDMTLGADSGGGTGAGFIGDVDELEISRVARPDGFVKFAAVSQQGSDDSSKLVGVGQDEQTSSWLSGNSTFGILIHSLTPDGWAVIFLLSIMAIVSWTVMISKNNYLNQNAKGNERFLKAWRNVAMDLTSLDDGDPDKVGNVGGDLDKKSQRALRQACIYRVYHVGVEEIQHRMVKGASRPGRVLSAQSIQAIRATLDGAMVRETQRLNKLMVFLTIAISGGPFLGLLGTVVGVMITFAAIAAAGDVNVNAIAPGIAAALLATVAGLAVAIPALFGYNYLISRIKETTSDMHVFVDEFVTKLAEFYRPRPEPAGKPVQPPMPAPAPAIEA